MGKQINYYLGYQDFLSVAQAALDCGCIIYRHAYEDGRWNLIGGTTLDIVKSNCRRYYFHIPALGSIDRKLVSNNAHLSDDFLFCVIEAGFTIPWKQEMVKNRLYIVTGRYTDDGCWASCPDMLTKVYNKLVRVVKKTAPYTEFIYCPEYIAIGSGGGGEVLIMKQERDSNTLIVTDGGNLLSQFIMPEYCTFFHDFFAGWVVRKYPAKEIDSMYE